LIGVYRSTIALINLDKLPKIKWNLRKSSGETVWKYTDPSSGTFHMTVRHDPVALIQKHIEEWGTPYVEVGFET
jgi:hypothetical protein